MTLPRPRRHPVSEPVLLAELEPAQPAIIAEVRAALMGLKTGVYPSALLYERYRRSAQRRKRKPVSRVVWAGMLREYGASRTECRNDLRQTVSCWDVVGPEPDTQPDSRPEVTR